jgi:hypothetical protein
MMLHKHDPDNLKPCPHMENLISAWVDGKLTGLKLWYTRWHVSQCPRCTSAIPILEALQGRLHRLSGTDAPEPLALTPERRAALEAAWEQADRAEETA